MSPSPSERRTSLLMALLLLAVVTACDFRITQERPSYEELDAHEKSVVEIVLAELRGFNAQVVSRTDLSIAKVIDRERINVSFEGHIFSANLGDDVIHVAPWENLSSGQQDLVATWFKSPSAASAQATYEKLFYRFLTVSQGAKQYMFEALTAEWVYSNRSLYNVERDTIRETLSYYRTIGKQTEMWNFATNACKPILAQYGSVYGPSFSKAYLADHFQELANPKAPTGYMYYICRWVEIGKVDAVSLTTELQWVQDLPSLRE